METVAQLPKVFRFEIGGYFGESHELEFRDGQLWYGRGLGGVIDPAARRALDTAPANWERWWRAIERAGVWDWERNYTTLDVCDGTVWALEIRHAGRSVVSEGMNGYPGGDGPVYARTSSFAKFLRAVQALTGVKGIR